MRKEYHTRSWVVRIPVCLLEPTIRESYNRGIGKPAPFLRMIMLERLRSLVECSSLKEIYLVRHKYIGSESKRLAIRFNDKGNEEILHAAETLTSGNISGLVIAILIERYHLTGDIAYK